MFVFIILAIVVTGACLIHDWQHEKSSGLEALNSYWVKYLGVFLVVAFATPYILAWKYFHYLLAAGSGVVLYLFWGVVLGWFKALFTKK